MFYLTFVFIDYSKKLSLDVFSFPGKIGVDFSKEAKMLRDGKREAAKYPFSVFFCHEKKLALSCAILKNISGYKKITHITFNRSWKCLFRI